LVPISPSSELGVESSLFLRERHAADLHTSSAIHASSIETWQALQLIARYAGFYDVLGVESVETVRL
jgi:hypothetical protein